MKNFMILNTTAGLIILTDENEIDGMKNDLLNELEKKSQTDLAIDHGQTERICKQDIKDMFLPSRIHFIRFTKDCSLQGFMRLLIDIPDFTDDNRILVISAFRVREVVANIESSKTSTFEKCKKIYDGIDLDQTKVFEKIDELIHLAQNEDNELLSERELSNSEVATSSSCVPKKNNGLTVTFSANPRTEKKPFSDAFYRSIFFDVCSFVVNESVRNSSPIVSNGVVNVTLKQDIREMHLHKDHITKPYANALINEISSHLPKTNDYYMKKRNGSEYINIIKRDSFPKPPGNNAKSTNSVANALPIQENKQVDPPKHDDIPAPKKMEKLTDPQLDDDDKEILFQKLQESLSFSAPTCTLQMNADNRLMKSLCKNDPSAISRWDIHVKNDGDAALDAALVGIDEGDQLKNSKGNFNDLSWEESDDDDKNAGWKDAPKKKTRSVGANYKSGTKPKEFNAESETHDDQMGEDEVYIDGYKIKSDDVYQQLTWGAPKTLEPISDSYLRSISEMNDGVQNLDVNERCFRFSGCLLMGEGNEIISINSFLKLHASCVGDYRCDHSHCMYLIHCLIAGKSVIIKNQFVNLYSGMSVDEVCILKSTLLYIFNCSNE